MEKSEIKEKYEEMKAIKDNPYGLSRIIKKDSSSNIIEDQTTPFDSFVNEDALRYFINKNKLDEIKEGMFDRIDVKTGLYEVTYGDKNPVYYDFATMFNRLTNAVYARKVFRQVKLLGEYTKLIRGQYTEAIKDSESRNTREEIIIERHTI